MKNTIIILVITQLLASVVSAQLCPPNCLVCNNGACTACDSTFYLSFGSCMPCADGNCATCVSSGAQCTSCISGYMPRISDSLCIQCSTSTDSNCCSGSNCAVCQTFALNDIGLCHSCALVYRSCQKCDNTRCLTCNSGFALNVTANYLQCVLCNIPRCAECTDGPVCLTCSNGYFAVNGSCSPCLLPCQTCSSNLTCLSCDPRNSLYIFSANSCLPCNDLNVGILGCATCSQNITNSSISCLTCLSGYYMSAPSCLTCISPCLTCTTSLNCQSCVNTSYAFNTTTYKCQNCSIYIPFCTTCVNTTTCLTCIDGYAISTNASLCVPCSSIVPACQFCNSLQCNSCLLGYTLQKDFTCSPLCQSPCIRCSNIATQCKSCIFGYYVSGTICLLCNTNCTSCSNATYCISCNSQYVNVNGSCQPCPTGQQFNSFSGTCQSCQPHCTSCYWWTGCDACQPMFQMSMLNGINICRDICGDTYAIDVPCDLTLGISNDGCTEQCTIQPNYNCSKSLNTFTINGTATSLNTSQCSFIGSISISIFAASQSIAANTLTLTFSITPYLYGFPTSADSQAYIQPIFQLGPLGASDYYTVSIDSASSLVTFEIHHTSDISQLGLTLTINTAALLSNQMFQYLPASTYAFQVNQILAYGRLGQYEEQDSLNVCKLIYNWSKLLAICSIFIMFIGMFGKQLVGLDQIVLCQGVFLILSFYQGQLNLPMMSLTGLKYSTGIHFGPDLIAISQNQHYIMGLDTSSFLYNFNYNLFAYLPPLVISCIILIYKLRYKHLPSRRDLAQQTYEVIMGQTILYLAVFNLTPLISFAYISYTQTTKDYYYDSIAIFLAGLFTIFGIFNYFVKPQIVGIFRSCFRAQSDMREAKLTGWRLKYTNCISKRFFQQNFSKIYTKITINFFVIYLIYLFALNLLIVFGIASPIIIVGIQIFMVTLIILVRPHFHVFQKLRAIITWSLALLGSLIVLLKPNSFILPIIFLTILSIHSVISVSVIVLSVIQQIKRKCNDRSEVVRKLMKEGHLQTQKVALRELILRYQDISRKNITIDQEVQKIQMNFNQDDIKSVQSKKQPNFHKIKAFKEGQDQQMVRFEDQIIQQEQDHFRFQKGLQFFNKYDGKIDQGLVKKEYQVIE